MKTLKFFVVLALFISATFNILAETGTCWVHIKLKTPIQHIVYTFDNIWCCCTFFGNNCIIVPCDNTKRCVVEVTTGGYILTGTLDEVKLSVREDSTSTTWTSITRDGKNYPFVPEEYLLIENCPDYPYLEGRSIDLGGAITDANGKFTLFVPSGNY